MLCFPELIYRHFLQILMPLRKKDSGVGLNSGKREKGTSKLPLVIRFGLGLRGVSCCSKVVAALWEALSRALKIAQIEIRALVFSRALFFVASRRNYLG